MKIRKIRDTILRSGFTDFKESIGAYMEFIEDDKSTYFEVHSTNISDEYESYFKINFEI